MDKGARALTKKLIKALEQTPKYEDDKEIGKQVWCAMSTATILRTAIPLARHAGPSTLLSDKPAEEEDEDLAEALGTDHPMPDRRSAPPSTPARPAASGAETAPVAEMAVDNTPIRVRCRPALSEEPPGRPAPPTT